MPAAAAGILREQPHVGRTLISAESPWPPWMLVQAHGLGKTYPKVRALDGVGFEIHEGEVFGLFGPNGAGKTTCLRVLSGLTRPDAGRAEVCGHDVAQFPNDLRRHLGILFDLPFPYVDMTVARYLTFFANMAGVPRAEVRGKAAWALAQLGMTHHAGSRIGKLSMGERQRVEIARVLLSPARLLLLDEPFSNVDVDARLHLRSILRDWVSRGGGILFTSHNLLESEAIVDRYAFIHLGRIVAVGTAKELKENLLAPVYALEVSDANMALAALEPIPHQALETTAPNLVRLGLLRRQDAPRVAKALVSADVDLLEMKSVGTMEDVYRKLTRPPGPGGTA